MIRFIVFNLLKFLIKFSCKFLKLKNENYKIWNNLKVVITNGGGRGRGCRKLGEERVQVVAHPKYSSNLNYKNTKKE